VVEGVVQVLHMLTGEGLSALSSLKKVEGTALYL